MKIIKNKKTNQKAKKYATLSLYFWSKKTNFGLHLQHWEILSKTNIFG